MHLWIPLFYLWVFYYLPSQHMEENFISIKVLRSGAEFCTRSFNRRDELLPGHWLRVEWLRHWPFKRVIFPFPVYRHFAFLKSFEVPNKFALKFSITWNLYLFFFACLVLNIQRGDVTENVGQMILKFLTFSVVECHFIFQTHKNVLSKMFYY